MVGMLEVSTGTDVAVARRRAVAEIKRAKAILSFTGSVDEASWAYLDELHGRALVAGAAELSEIQAVLTSENEAAVEYFGIRSVDQVEAFLERLEGRLTDEENVLYVPKVELDSLCTNYAPSAPTYRHLPPHCLFPIKPSGLRHHNPGPALLEADLYFDMATLWNALDQGQGRTVGEGGWLVDEGVTLGRATIRAAFSLLEGYVNGIGLDVVLTSSGELSDKEVAYLTEWDRARSRPRALPLEEKVREYTRAAVDAKLSPVGTDLEPFASLLSAQREYRNALTHPSVGFRGLSDYKEPVDVLMLLSKDEVAKVCDLVVGAIFALNEAIARRFQDVAVWLHERGPDGTFPMPGTYGSALLGQEPAGHGGDAAS